MDDDRSQEIYDEHVNYDALVDETEKFVEEAAVIEARVEALANSIGKRHDGRSGISPFL